MWLGKVMGLLVRVASQLLLMAVFTIALPAVALQAKVDGIQTLDTSANDPASKSNTDGETKTNPGQNFPMRF